MRRADAPRPGWYPDPTGDHRLRWWDGTDWTDHRRIRPPREGDGGDGSAPAGTGSDTTSAGATAPDRAVRTAARSVTGQADQTAAMVAEARKVARDEVDRAVRDVTRKVEHARGRYEPMVREYLGRARRWLRTLAIAAVIVAVLWVVVQTVAQVSFLDWLGERVDAVTAVVHGGARWFGT